MSKWLALGILSPYMIRIKQLLTLSDLLWLTCSDNVCYEAEVTLSMFSLY